MDILKYFVIQLNVNVRFLPFVWEIYCKFNWLESGGQND